MGEWKHSRKYNYYYWANADGSGGIPSDQLEEARDKLNRLIEERDTQLVELVSHLGPVQRFRLCVRSKDSCVLGWSYPNGRYTEFDPSCLSRAQLGDLVAEAYRAGQRSEEDR